MRLSSTTKTGEAVVRGIMLVTRQDHESVLRADRSEGIGVRRVLLVSGRAGTSSKHVFGRRRNRDGAGQLATRSGGQLVNFRSQRFDASECHSQMSIAW